VIIPHAGGGWLTPVTWTTTARGPPCEVNLHSLEDTALQRRLFLANQHQQLAARSLSQSLSLSVGPVRRQSSRRLV